MEPALPSDPGTRMTIALSVTAAFACFDYLMAHDRRPLGVRCLTCVGVLIVALGLVHVSECVLWLNGFGPCARSFPGALVGDYWGWVTSWLG